MIKTEERTVRPADDAEKRKKAIALLQSWRDGDDDEQEEQCATWAFLRTALNDNRLSERKRL